MRDAYDAANEQPGGSDGWIQQNCTTPTSTSTRKQHSIVVQSAGRFPNTMAAKHYDKNLIKRPRPVSCTPESCNAEHQCLWCRLPEQWLPSKPVDSSVFKARKIPKVTMVVTTPPTNVPVVDASTALALGSQGQHSSSLSHALWVSVLNQFFGLSSDAIASEPIQMLLKEPLIVEASTNFAIGCQRYHDSLLKYQQVKLTKQRDRSRDRERGKCRQIGSRHNVMVTAC